MPEAMTSDAAHDLSTRLSHLAPSLVPGSGPWLQLFGYLAEGEGWELTESCTCQEATQDGHAPQCGWVREG